MSFCNLLLFLGAVIDTWYLDDLGEFKLVEAEARLAVGSIVRSAWRMPADLSPKRGMLKDGH